MSSMRYKYQQIILFIIVWTVTFYVISMPFKNSLVRDHSVSPYIFVVSGYSPKCGQCATCQFLLYPFQIYSPCCMPKIASRRWKYTAKIFGSWILKLSSVLVHLKKVKNWHFGSCQRISRPPEHNFVHILSKSWWSFL